MRVLKAIPLFLNSLAFLADFLNQLIGLDGKPEGNLDRRLARDIERGILLGKVRMERSIVGYPEFFYRPTGWTTRSTSDEFLINGVRTHSRRTVPASCHSPR